jgi:hypothetical protein
MPDGELKVAIRLWLLLNGRMMGMPQTGRRRAPARTILQDNSGERATLTFAICDPQSKIENSQGGIAQLVERQLCKLEVRGSNPLASSLRSRR